MNRSIQGFLRDTYGIETWLEVARRAEIEPSGFEAMLVYEDRLTYAVLDAAGRCLDRPREIILEDLGTYLVTHPNAERLRRILRFGGATFVDFLHSLDDLPERVRLAVPEFDFPGFSVQLVGDNVFRLTCTWHHPGVGSVMTGLLRTLADDYGVLAYLESGTGVSGDETVDIHLLDSGFATGRSFELAEAVARDARG